MTPDNELIRRLGEIDAVRVDTETRLADLTTLRLGGRPAATVRCASPEAVCAAVGQLDAAGAHVLVVGGGSNLVVVDGELDLYVVVLECDEVAVDAATGLVRAQAGAVWDEVVATSVTAGLGGIECLSGIPGSAGATPVQNVGAYGAEVGDRLTRVRLWDRARRVDEWVPAASLELAYRWSNLKYSGRAVVLEIELQLACDGLSAPLRFGALARALGAEHADERFPAAQVREEVLKLRRGKGMVLDADDHDTWSAGSFFTNPVVDAESADAVCDIVRATYGDTEADGMPRYPAPGGVKLSAAWLIERAGFPRGYPDADAPVRVSTRHTLALTNRGGARTADLVGLAREIRDGVRDYFGVTLVPEPVWVGVELDG